MQIPTTIYSEIQAVKTRMWNLSATTKWSNRTNIYWIYNKRYQQCNAKASGIKAGETIVQRQKQIDENAWMTPIPNILFIDEKRNYKKRKNKINKNIVVLYKK